MRQPVGDTAAREPSASKKKHFQMLDGLRGVAAIAVMVMHIALWFYSKAFFGGAGLAVDFFFCLSGFVIYHAYADKLADGLPIGRFLQLRMLRLYPLIVLGFVLGAVYAVLASLSNGQMTVPVIDIARSLALSLLLIPHENSQIASGIFPLNGVAWSLFFELVANLVLAGLVIGIGRRKARVVAAALVVGGLALATHYNTMLQGFTINTLHVGLARVFISFFIGGLLYEALDARPLRIQLSDWIFVPLAAAMVLCFYVQSRYPSVGWETICVLLIFPAIILLGSASRMGRLAPLLKTLGDLSYPLYLIQIPAIFITVGVGKRLPFFHGSADPALLVVSGVVAIAVAWAAFKFYDQPIRARFAQQFRTKQAAAVAGA